MQDTIFNTIVLGGKKYRLVPLEEERPVVLESRITVSPKDLEDINEDVRGPDSGEIKIAVPKLSGHRERFIKRELLPTDVTAPRSKIVALPNNNSEMDDIERSIGRKVWVGEGTQIDF
jgi:hypothetical protein